MTKKDAVMLLSVMARFVDSYNPIEFLSDMEKFSKENHEDFSKAIAFAKVISNHWSIPSTVGKIAEC